jgi:hypothetical protein
MTFHNMVYYTVLSPSPLVASMSSADELQRHTLAFYEP